MNLEEMERLGEKLVELTSRGWLAWKLADSKDELPADPDQWVDLAYIAKFQGKNIRLFEYRYKYYEDELVYHWSSGISLQIIDDTGKVLYQFPTAQILYDLLREVQKKTSGVDEFVKSILNFS